MTFLKRLFSRKYHPKPDADGRYSLHPSYTVSTRNARMPIQYAFSCGGKDYYSPVDKKDFGPQRMATYELHLMAYQLGVDYEYLTGWNERLADALKIKDGEFNLPLALWLHYELQQRLEHVRPERYIYRLCSAYFFDLEEDLTLYDLQSCNDKIDFWMQHKQPAAFFFSKPVRQLLNLPQQSEAELRRDLQENAIALALIAKKARQLSGILKKNG